MPHREPKNRLLFIGLDAADARLIDEWSRADYLPSITEMKARGTWLDLSTTAEVFHVSAWPSMFTGTTPDKHGLYHAYVTQPGHQGVLRPRPDETPFPFFWRLLSDAGKQSIVMDAFLTCPLQPFNGVQIVDWGSWSWFWDPTIIPASVERQIGAKFGRYPSEDHSKVGMVPVGDFEGFRNRLLAAVATKTRVLKWLMDTQEWELCLAVFGESHPAGHYFWHFQDPAYVTHSPTAAVVLRETLRDVYAALDRAIGELLREIDSRTTVIVASGDGIGPNYSGSHLLTDVLKKIGVFNSADPARAQTNEPARDIIGALRNMIPERLRLAVSTALLSRHMQEQLSLRWKTAGIAWARTRAFVIENANEGYIRINLSGREPQGCVSPGRDYEELCDDICRTVRTMINPITDRRAAAAVYKTDDLYSGPRRSHMPDIVIIWDVEARVTTELLMDKYGAVRAGAPSCGVAPFYTGNHRPNAFAVAVGPGVPEGRVVESRSILDLAPTILRRFDMAAPAYMDGKPIDELCSTAASPIRC